MQSNLLSLTQQSLGTDFSRLAGQFLGESPGATQSALTALLPTVLGSITHKGATPEGASGLMSLINGANLDTGALGNVSALFGAGGAGLNGLLKAGTHSLVPALFGDKTGAVVDALSASSGIKRSSATSLVAMVVPLVLTFLKKFIGDRGLDAGSLASLLGSQGSNLQGALDSRLTSAAGLAGQTAGASAAQALDTAKTAGAAIAGRAGATATAAASAGKSGLMRWLPWLLGLAGLLVVWNLISSRLATKPMPAPAAVAVALPAKVFFDVGSAAIGEDNRKTIAAVAAAAKKDAAKLAITGYTDKTGDAATNEELAKRRAVAVQEALRAEGVPDASMEMRPPLFVERGAGGSDAEARRVEINRQ